MLKRPTRWGLPVAALMTISLMLVACGEPSATPPAVPTVAQAPAAPQAAPPVVPVVAQPAAPVALQSAVPLGAKSTLAGSFADNTPIFISLNTDSTSDQSKSFGKTVEYFSNIPDVKKALAQLEMLKVVGLDYETGIKPWLGNEVALSLTDFAGLQGLGNNKTALPTGDLPILIGMLVSDRPKAEAFVTKTTGLLKSFAQATIQEDTYKDVKLTTIKMGTTSLVIGLGKDKLFVGGNLDTVKAAFDRSAAQSLASNANYTTIAAKLPSSNLSFAYVDAQAAIKSLVNSPQFKQNGPNLQLPNADYIGSLGLTTAATDEGYRLDSYQVYIPGKTPPAVATQLGKAANSGKILSALPEATLFFANGQDAASGYDALINAMKTSGNADFDKKLAEFEQQSGLNLKSDVVSLFSGEFTAFAVPETANQAMPVSFGLVSQVGDKTATQAKLDKIAAAIEQQSKGQVKWQTKTVGSTTYRTATITQGQTTTSLNLGQGNGSAVPGGSFAFLTVGDEATNGLLTAAGGGKNFLAGPNAANFNKVKAQLPTDNGGYVYLDTQAAIKLAVAQPLPSDATKAEKAKAAQDFAAKLDKLYAVGAATHQTASEAASTVFVYFPVTK